MTAAYKFLAAGAVGPFSGVAWPTPIAGAPAAWLEAAGPVATRGLHVCRAGDLAHWLHDELWQLDTDGPARAGLDCVIVERARLVRRITAWDAGGAARFAAACIAHAALAPADADASTALLDDARQAAEAGYVAIAAYCAALALGKRGGEPAYRDERAWQAGWIARTLIGG